MRFILLGAYLCIAGFHCRVLCGAAGFISEVQELQSRAVSNAVHFLQMDEASAGPNPSSGSDGAPNVGFGRTNPFSENRRLQVAGITTDKL
jgi:hypothetical protein